MLAGVQLARAGVPAVVLEKHRDLLRDFRGDTVPASTLQVMRVPDASLERPHRQLRLATGTRTVLAGITRFVASAPA